MTKLKSLLKREEGSAMTEFAIMVPSIMMIFLYSIFFTDMVEVKLKTLEASRYMTWESVVYRDGASIQQEIETRFVNLRSTDIEEAETLHMIGLENVVVTSTYTDSLEVDMTGGVPDDGSTSEIGGIDSTINSVIGWMRLPTQGKARSEVTITTENKIIPDFMMLNTEIKADEEESVVLGSDEGFGITSHHVLVYDTWKGWPNKNRRVGDRNGTTASPTQTYPVAEKAMADQLSPVAYFKLGDNSLMDTIMSAMSFFGLPPFITSKQGTDGPTTMLPPESTSGIESFSPSRGKNTTRWGHRYSSSILMADNPNPSIDHSRWTLPYSISTGRYGGKTITWWHGLAGSMVRFPRDYSMNRRPVNTTLLAHQTRNDYYLSYNCRGHFYDGYIQSDGQAGDYRNFNGCGDTVDGVQGAGQDLLDRFGGGLQLPGF